MLAVARLVCWVLGGHAPRRSVVLDKVQKVVTYEWVCGRCATNLEK